MRPMNTNRCQTVTIPSNQQLFLGVWEDEDLGRQHMYFLAESREEGRQLLGRLVSSNTLRVEGPMAQARTDG